MLVWKIVVERAVVALGVLYICELRFIVCREVYIKLLLTLTFG